MRLIVLCLSPGQGGLELYALEEIKQLTQRGHECFAVVAKNSYMEKVLIKNDIPHSVLDVKFKRFPLIAARKLRSIAQDFNADVLHFHWANDLYLAAVFKSMVGDSVKLVHSRHMNYTRNKKDILHRWYYNKIDLLIAGTQVLFQLASKYLPLPKDKIQLLYIGTAAPSNDIPNCKFLFANDKFKKRKLNIAIFGRIEEGKGQHIVVDAMQKLLKEKKDISLTMIGHTMDKSYQNQLVEKIKGNGINNFIRFKGFIESAITYMPCFDVVVLSTHCETFGLVLIEAMRAGVTVVGTNAGGVPEIIEHNISGCLVEPRNAESMQSVLTKLYDDIDYRNRLAKAGQQRADSLFSDEVHYPKLEKMLNSIL